MKTRTKNKKRVTRLYHVSCLPGTRHHYRVTHRNGHPAMNMGVQAVKRCQRLPWRAKHYTGRGANIYITQLR